MGKVTIRDRKAVIFDEYQKVLDELNKTREIKFDPKEQVEKEKREESVNQSDNLSDSYDSVSFKDAFVSQINSLEEMLSSGFDKYSQLKEAISAKEDRLHDLLGIEAEVNSLAALVETQDALKDKFELESKVKRDELTQALNDLQEQIKKTKSNSNKERIRDEEEYRYQFDRKKAKDMDKLNDELSLKRKEWKDFQNAEQVKLNDFDSELKAMKQFLEKWETELKERQEEFDNMPKVIKEEVSKKVAKQSAIIKAKMEAEKKLKEAEHVGQVQLLESKIDSLTKLTELQNSEIESLKSKLDHAYSEVRSIATDTVKGVSMERELLRLQQNQSTRSKD